VKRNHVTAPFRLLAFLLRRGGAEVFSVEHVHAGKWPVGTLGYVGTSRFWFGSLQNWQSEFLSILSIIGLSLFLR